MPIPLNTIVDPSQLQRLSEAELSGLIFTLKPDSDISNRFDTDTVLLHRLSDAGPSKWHCVSLYRGEWVDHEIVVDLSELYERIDDPQGPDHWYVHNQDLNCGDIFVTHNKEIVYLDSRVIGDGTKWDVIDWYDGRWTNEGGTIEPGELWYRLKSDPKTKSKI